MTKKKRQSLEKRLKAYSAAAAGTLLLAPSANAAIQYSGPMNITVDANNTPVSLDLDGNLTDDFVVSLGQFNNIYAHSIRGTNHISNSVINSNLGAPVAPPEQIPIFRSLTIGSILVANLPSNYSVQTHVTSQHAWRPFGMPDRFDTTGSYAGITGNFNDTTGYMGIRFDTACGLAFGWIRYSATADSTSSTIIDWAYEDNCGVPILAGDQGAPAVGVPTLNQWGLFALIALLAGAGVMMLRKQEEA